LARESHLIIRRPKKIEPITLVLAIIKSSLNSANSLSNIAENIALYNNETVSKQAVHKRINAGFVYFVQLLLAFAISEKIKSTVKHKSEVFKHFKDVFIQDSTNIPLSEKLASFFPGAKNGSSKENASLKIQAVYSVLTEQFVHFFTSPFTTNDQSQAENIINFVPKGALIIRDLGYFTLKSLASFIKLGIFFLSLLQKNVNLYDAKTKKELNLVHLLKKKNFLDMDVIVGKQSSVKARLIALPVDEKTAQKRREKAKYDRDRRVNHSKNYFFLLGWTIFITNVPRDVWNAQDAFHAYQIRWRIEIIFKTWKSAFHIDNISSPSKNMVLAFIYSMLFFITLFTLNIYDRLLFRIKDKKLTVQISLLKLANFLQNIDLFPLYLAYPEEFLDKYFNQIIYYCAYEKRKDRINYLQLLTS
jgi:hypothetical protein